MRAGCRDAYEGAGSRRATRCGTATSKATSRMALTSSSACTGGRTTNTSRDDSEDDSISETHSQRRNMEPLVPSINLLIGVVKRVFENRRKIYIDIQIRDRGINVKEINEDEVIRELVDSLRKTNAMVCRLHRKKTDIGLHDIDRCMIRLKVTNSGSRAILIEEVGINIYRSDLLKVESDIDHSKKVGVFKRIYKRRMLWRHIRTLQERDNNRMKMDILSGKDIRIRDAESKTVDIYLTAVIKLAALGKIGDEFILTPYYPEVPEGKFRPNSFLYL